MGEEEKKPDEKTVPVEEMDVQKPPPEDVSVKKKKDENKPSEKSAPDKEEKKTEDSKDGEEPTKEQAPPLPPPEIVLKVYMHCEGCARKVRRCLRGFEGVEDVITDCKTHKVVVKGEKADPLKVLDRVQRKSHRQVELLSPIPKPPAPEESKPEEKEKPKPEEKKEEPQVVTVVLRVHMHCEACAQEIKKRILRMKGVDAVEADLKGSQVSVTGVFDPPKLVDYVHKRTGKHAVIVKTDPEKKEKEAEAKEAKEEKPNEESVKEKKGDDGGESKEGKKEAEGGGGGGGGEAKATVEVVPEETILVELKKNEYYQHYPQRYAMEMYAYPPQIFSDENPNACCVM
ncbi:heavy metal-associated isoprenylated plant protein 7-like [Benincasa hispida]|uniref:heavy metal-associated isoprenylated plant protein 7-like n=1 Tax=Benincasa hispida TaxID=102211 RepID=UPI0019011932|nr:heavy metal-associated isoprenylated plant protein 7-like [Benincasa hispida]